VPSCALPNSNNLCFAGGTEGFRSLCGHAKGYELLLAHFLHRFPQHLDVQLGPNTVGGPTLIRPEERAGAADLEIALRHLEASSEPGEVLDCVQPILRLRTELLACEKNHAASAAAATHFLLATEGAQRRTEEHTPLGYVITAYACSPARPTRPRNWWSEASPNMCACQMIMGLFEPTYAWSTDK